MRTETPHIPVVEPLAEPDDPEYEDVTHCRAALYISVVTLAAGYLG